MEKRILLLIDSFGAGGVERNMTYLTRLQEKGFRISARSVLDTDHYHEFPSGIVNAPLLRNAKRRFRKGRFAAASMGLLALGLHLHRFPFSFRKTQIVYKRTLEHLNNYYYGCRALNQIIEQEKPNLIMTFRRHSALIALMTTFVYGLKLPVYCSHRSNQSIRISILPHPGLFRFAANRFYKRADFHTAVSDGVRQDIISNFGVPTSNIATVYNGVDIELVRAKVRESVEDDEINRILSDRSIPKIVNMGRLVESKGHAYLLKAFQLVSRKIDCRLLIAGDGDQRKYLESLSRELNIESSVFFLGRQKNPFKFIAHGDVFVSSSLTDGLPNVLLEAMACELPIIATDCQFGPSEILDHGKYGVLVPIKNENALSDAILRILGDEGFRSELRKRSSERIQGFRVETMLKKYEKLFAGDSDELLNKVVSDKNGRSIE